MSKYFIGQTIDQFTIQSKQTIDGKTFYNGVCSCGKNIKKMSHQLSCLNVRCVDCGNLASGKKRRTFTNEHKDSSEYRTWSNMKNRCSNKKYYLYHRYGGRGITVSLEWENSFEQFYSDMGGKPTPQHSIDRINNDLGYSKENCKWSTSIEQSNNRKTNRIIEMDGETKSLAEWCREYNISYSLVQSRMDRFGLRLKEAIVQGDKNMQDRYVYMVGDITFNTNKEVAEHFNISLNASRNRFVSDNYKEWIKKVL